MINFIKKIYREYKNRKNPSYNFMMSQYNGDKEAIIQVYNNAYKEITGKEWKGK